MDFADDRSRSTSPSSRGGGDSAGRGAANGAGGRSQGCILFVGNLPFQAPWQNIKDQFRKAGKVRYTDLIADRTGRPKGSALVTMSTPEGAQRAIQIFNETEFEGRRLIVRSFDDGPRPQLVSRENMPTYARFRGSDGGPRGNDSRQQHQQRGAQSKPQPPQQRQQAPPQAKPKMAAHTESDVPRPRSQQSNEDQRKLFISNLPFDCTAMALKTTFEQVGEVARTEIIVGRNGKSRGMGIVVMTTADLAQIAIDEFDKIEMAGRPMNVRLDNKQQ